MNGHLVPRHAGQPGASSSSIQHDLVHREPPKGTPLRFPSGKTVSAIFAVSFVGALGMLLGFAAAVPLLTTQNARAARAERAVITVAELAAINDKSAKFWMQQAAACDGRPGKPTPERGL